ncbi:hypothetical protein DENSPDRAFT_429929 [Dentipellis sp. KUC8613]|nr:hypothetical protein DENSPDRAFT_429929 [Dentipellis sp. KUC8613]
MDGDGRRLTCGMRAGEGRGGASCWSSACALTIRIRSSQPADHATPNEHPDSGASKLVLALCRAKLKAVTIRTWRLASGVSRPG